MVAKCDYVDGVVKALESRGKGKLDMIEIRQVRGEGSNVWKVWEV